MPKHDTHRPKPGGSPHRFTSSAPSDSTPADTPDDDRAWFADDVDDVDDVDDRQHAEAAQPAAAPAPRLRAPNGLESRAVGWALHHTAQFQADGFLVFPEHPEIPSLSVRLHAPEHLSLTAQEIQERCQLRPADVDLIRVALEGLWHQARLADAKTPEPVIIAVEALFATLGKRPHHGSWRTRDEQDLLAALRYLALVHLLGKVADRHQNEKQPPRDVRGPYLSICDVWEPNRRGEPRLVAVEVAPGPWWQDRVNHHTNLHLRLVDPRIFCLNQREHGLAQRLYLYLTEAWRRRAYRRTYTEPFSTRMLLVGSGSRIEYANPVRCASRFEHALRFLVEQGLVGAAVCHEPLTRLGGRWFEEWLRRPWYIPPPDQDLDLLEQAVRHAAGSCVLPPVEVHFVGALPGSVEVQRTASSHVGDPDASHSPDLVEIDTARAPHPVEHAAKTVSPNGVETVPPSCGNEPASIQDPNPQTDFNRSLEEVVCRRHCITGERG